IEFLIQGGTVQRIADPDEDIFYFNSKDKIRLNIYKNIFVHHFVIPSLIALKLKQGVKTREKLLEDILFFDNLFRYEFMFPRAYDFTVAINTMISFSLDRGLITENDGELYPNPDKDNELSLLANILQPFLESFYVAIKVLTSKKVSFPQDADKLVDLFRDNHQKYLLLGKVNSLEGNLTISYKNIIRFFTEEKIILSTRGKGKKTMIRKDERFLSIHDLYKKLFPKMGV
ncbi:MAG: hypothetical protein ABIK68_20840, partial [bacterium]